MVDTYTIYLVNKSADTQLFWCFLAPPQELVNDPKVYANSSANLAVRPNSVASNYFQIPIQYLVGAGASTNAVGLNVVVVSNVINDANLQDTWEASYANWPPNEGPTMAKTGVQAPANTIAIASNPYDKVNNENNGWFANQSFGIQSEAGFIGMTWDPAPNQTRTLTPKLTFYLATGDYNSNALASWNDVSNDAQAVNAPGDFSYNKCTVTYSASGTWSVTPGEPPTLALAEDLDWFLSDAHNELVALAYLNKGKGETDKLVSVHWDSTASRVEGPEVFITGTITVATALTAAFTYFFISGVKCDIRSRPSGTTVRFSYDGNQSAQHIKSLFTVGASLIFGGAR
ncbi:hypothetical protein [Bradyrhizobium lablabi]|uniref:hypothetical protein n=1 Tax=Bradyrhizobium lablabi TaxID=722472 RepID=UPI001BAD6161|nr:hypothetical protein [Bradyrhizobium lablabi]MBR0695882.1 hypothetical protein [Bradyrhizobium lablabi]